MSFNPNNLSIVMPVYNTESTIADTLRSLYKQKSSFGQLIIVDDGSNDQSINIAKKILTKMPISYQLIRHRKNLGLANSYNDGIRRTRSKFIITMHADIILKDGAIKALVSPLIGDKNIVAAYHAVVHPLRIWLKYPFWQKCLFSRLAQKEFSGLDGKFDCFRRSVLLDIGLFDGNTFKRAGEDADIVYRFKQKGEVVKTEAKIIHIHNADYKFSLHDYIYKHKQYAEAQGALLRHGRYFNIFDIMKSFFREFLFIALLLSLISPYSLVLMSIMVLAYTYFYTRLVYRYEIKNPRIIILPFVNFYLLFISLIYSAKGFIYGKQQI